MVMRRTVLKDRSLELLGIMLFLNRGPVAVVRCSHACSTVVVAQIPC